MWQFKMTNMFLDVTDTVCLTQNVPQTKHIQVFVPIIPIPGSGTGSGTGSNKPRKLSSKPNVENRKVITVVFEEKRLIEKDELAEEDSHGGWGWCMVS
jgi:hypothetical protein